MRNHNNKIMSENILCHNCSLRCKPQQQSIEHKIFSPIKNKVEKIEYINLRKCQNTRKNPGMKH